MLTSDKNGETSFVNLQRNEEGQRVWEEMMSISTVLEVGLKLRQSTIYAHKVHWTKLRFDLICHAKIIEGH